MKLTSMPSRITVRLDGDLSLSLDILQKAAKTDKAKLVRMILKDFFDKNSTLLDKYYEETKTN
jgi:hypothetical protein